MSDLSFLIQTQNEVQIDLTYLKQCQRFNKQNQIKKHSSGLNKMLSKKQMRLRKSKTQLRFKEKQSFQKQFKNLFSTDNQQQISTNKSAAYAVSEKELIKKITIRVEALQEKQKKLEQKIGVQFFEIKQQIKKTNFEQNLHLDDVKRIKNDLNDTKRKIGSLSGVNITKNK